MKSRDRAAVAAYRSALSALDNASAVPLTDEHKAGAIEASAVGPSAADVPRVELAEDEQREIILREVNEALDAAASMGADESAAAHMRIRADLLRAVLAESRLQS